MTPEQKQRRAVKNRIAVNKYQKTKKHIVNAYRHHLKKRYGLTLEQYSGMLAAQKGVCAICLGRPAQKLNVDHCHATGRIRGLLCWRCNVVIGYMKDLPVLLRLAADYLEKHNGCKHE